MSLVKLTDTPPFSYTSRKLASAMEMERVFDPAFCNSDDPPEDPKYATYYDGLEELTFIERNTNNYPERRPDMLCISVDGACSNNGYGNDRASAGVFFGPQSRHNWSGVLNRNTHLQTNQSAETFAMIQALSIFNQNRSEYPWDEIHTIVIVTDSDYAFRGITSHVDEWRRSGYTHRNGEAVVNGDNFRQLDSLIGDLEVDGIDVVFWKVDPEFNQKADGLARSEL